LKGIIVTLWHFRLKFHRSVQQAEEGIMRAQNNSVVCRGFKTLEMVKLSTNNDA
jgi:hypothetical protein